MHGISNAHRTLVGRALVDRCGVVVRGQFGIPRIHKEKSVGVVRVASAKIKQTTDPALFPPRSGLGLPGWEASIPDGRPDTSAKPVATA